MIDWNKRNGGFLDDFNVMNYQVTNLSQQVDKLKQELQRKDNIISELKELVENELPYLYEIDKEYENIEGNTYFIYKEYDYKKILDKIKELEEK